MQYSVKGTDGNTYGPVDLITLKQWVQEGRVLPNAQVTDNLSNRTMQASQMPELGLSAGPTNPYANAPVPPANYNPYPRDGQMGQMNQMVPQGKNCGQLSVGFAWPWFFQRLPSMVESSFLVGISLTPPRQNLEMTRRLVGALELPLAAFL